MERNASPRYQYTNGKRTQTGWEEHAYFKVESKDFEALNRLIADSINIAVLESSSFSVSKEKREETVDQLSKAVILRFKDRAQNLAQTLGFSSYKSSNSTWAISATAKSAVISHAPKCCG